MSGRDGSWAHELAGGAAERELLLVVVADESWLLRLEDVREVIGMVALSTVHGPAGCRGMVNLRGEVIPVFEADGVERRLSPSRFIVVARTGAGPVGIIVDDVHDVIRAKAQDVVPRPVGGGRMVEMVLTEGRLLQVIEPEEVIAHG